MEDYKLLSEKIQQTLVEIQTKIDILKNLQPITLSGLIVLDLIGQMPLYGLQYIFGGVILGYVAMESMIGIPNQITILEEEYQLLTELDKTMHTRNFDEVHDEYMRTIEYLSI
jgi:hypothetical protein